MGMLIRDEVARRTFKLLCRTATSPSISDLRNVSPSLYVSATDLLQSYFGASETTLAEIKAEFQALLPQLRERYNRLSGSLAYPDVFAIEDQTSFLLYALSRILVPTTVLETGVANGHSTFFLLHAVLKNGRGSLHSIDIAYDVGQLLSDTEKAMWSLHVLRGRPLRRSFARLIDALPQIDLFFHDSNHSYLWQAWELHCIRSKMNFGSVLISDDVDASCAFQDFCARFCLESALLIDRRKVTGLLRFCNSPSSLQRSRWIKLDSVTLRCVPL